MRDIGQMVNRSVRRGIGFQQLPDNEVDLRKGRFVDLQQVRCQLTLDPERTIEPGPMLFQVPPSHLAILPDIHLIFRVDGQVGIEVVALLDVSDLHNCRLLDEMHAFTW